MKIPPMRTEIDRNGLRVVWFIHEEGWGRVEIRIPGDSRAFPAVSVSVNQSLNDVNKLEKARVSWYSASNSESALWMSRALKEGSRIAARLNRRKKVVR